MANTILVVEDNALNMKLFRDILEASGYEVVETADGAEAVRLAQAHMPDLILMDIQLEGGVTGLEVTQKIKSNPAIAHIPIVAVTAFAMKGDEERILNGGCEEYVSKPIAIGPFLQLVARYMKKDAA